MPVPKSLLRRIMSSAFARMGPDARQHAAGLVERSYEEIAYRRIAAFGYLLSAIVDIGAYHGNWTRLARRVFGQAPSLMIEAQAKLMPALNAFAASEQNLHAAHCVLGAANGKTVTFHEMGTGSSIFPEASNAGRQSVTMITQRLDDIVQEALGDRTDIFLKIDVQGAELDVLAGGLQTLARASLVQLELAMLPYNEGAPMLGQVVHWMEDQSWFPTELSGFSRPRDRLVQIDMLFAKADSPLRPTFFDFQGN